MNTQAVVFIVDDDSSVRCGISNLLRSAGHPTKAYASGREFLNQFDDESGCIILDLHMPQSSGLEVQQSLTVQKCHLPIIFLTGFGDVPSTVTALKAGAVNFLEKPIDEQALLTAVDEALNVDHENRKKSKETAQLETRLASLTEREFEVLRHVIAGWLNKQIAYALDISEKTVKVHRARIMEKMAVRSVAELVRLTEKLNVLPSTTKVQ